MINFGRSIPLILLFFLLLPIPIVFGQFGLENAVNRGKSLFGSIFGRNAPKNWQNKLAKNTTIFTTNSTTTTTIANSNINNSNLIGNNISDFGLATMSMSLAPKNATIGQQLTSKHLEQNNSLSSSISTTTIHAFKNNSQMTDVMENQLTSTIPSFSDMNSPTAPTSTLLNSKINSSISSPGINFSMSTANPFINATFHNFLSTISPSIFQNASSHQFGLKNATTISPPISQINPSILNQNNQGNLLDEQNGTKINETNKLIESTETFMNQNKNAKELNELNEFPSTKAILLEEKWQKGNHEGMKTENDEEKFGNGTNGIGRILDGSSQNGSNPNGSIQIFNPSNRTSLEEYSQNRKTTKQQLFPSPSPLPVQQFVGNNSANQNSTNFNNNSLNDLNNLEKNLVTENVQQEKNEIIENKTAEITKMNVKNGRQQNGNDNQNQQKEIQNNFGMINNKTMENENANQIFGNEFGNRTTKNETRIEVKNILKMTNGNETQMEISKTIQNEQNGSKELITERIETKLERKLEMNKTENKFDGNERRNGNILNGNQLNQTNELGINQTLLRKFGWNQTLTRENERINQSTFGGNVTTNPNKLLNGFGLNESLSIRGNQQPNQTLVKQQEILNKTNQIEGITSNQTSLFDGSEPKQQQNSIVIEGGDNSNRTLTKQNEINLNKTKNSTELPSNQMEIGSSLQNGQNIGPLITNSISNESSSTTSSMATTQLSSTIATTQDPIVRKELEKVGAPDVLKQLVPPKAEPITEQAKQIIEDKCANGKCLEQKAEFKEQRIVVSKQEEVVEQKLNPGKPPEQVKKEVEQRISKIFQLKKALMKSAGLEGKVEPANNGVFQADLLLTEEQATTLIAELERQRAQKGQGGRKKRAGNAIFMENSATQRWPLNTPIQFMFDQSLVEKDRQAVKQAIAEIQSKTCLKFNEAYSIPAGSHLYYTKIANPTFCGLSYVGRIESANPIYLSFMCGNEVGIGLHETLHALGFQHEQLRFDRDQFITIQWENVNPQQLDFFAISDVTKFSSYGLRYDYGSIMHYSATIAAQNAGKKTMMAKLAPAINDPLMGQRKGLSLSDVDALNKMYCSPGCEDKLVYCGLWATLNLCNPQMWRRVVTHQWIVSNCQKSCNKCGEKLEPVPNRPF